MSQYDSHVRMLYRFADHDPAVPRGCGQLIEDLFDDRDVVVFETIPRPRWNWRVIRRESGWRCSVPATIRPTELQDALSTAIARWYVETYWFEGLGYSLTDFAAAIALPDPALHIAHDVLRYDVPTIASLFVVRPELVVARLRMMQSPDASGEYPCVQVAG